MNSYEMFRAWFDFSFSNPEKINPNHTALLAFAIEHCNRLGWKKNFGLPTTMAMEAIGMRSYKTYSKTIQDLESFGFIEMVEKSKNQYSSNIVALVKNTKALSKALSKASLKHVSKQVQSIVESKDSIDKPINHEQLNHEPISFKKETKGNSVDFDKLLSVYNEIYGHRCTVVSLKVQRAFKARLKEGYNKQQIVDSMRNVHKTSFHRENNYLHATLEFFSRSSTLDKYSSNNLNYGTQQSISNQTGRKPTINDQIAERRAAFERKLDESIENLSDERFGQRYPDRR